MSLKNFRAGYVGCLLFRILFPWYVVFKIDSFQVGSSYLLVLFLIVAWFVQKDRNVFPKYLFHLFLFYVGYTLVLIFFSSAVIPYGMQFRGVVARIFLGDVGWFVLGVYAFKNGDFFCRKLVAELLFVIGVYGIVAYILNVNIWTNYLSLLYDNDDRFAFFLNEVRGNLIGRTSGTFEHPLAWGQFWNIILCALVVRKNEVSLKVFALLVVVSLLNIYFSGSRAALLTALLTMGVLFFSYKMKKIAKIAAFAVAAAFFVVPNMSSKMVDYLETSIFFWQKASQKTYIVGSSTDMRYDQYNAAVEIVMNNPIGGMGFDLQNYHEFLPGIYHRLMGYESVVIKLMVEQGLVGLVCFFVFFYYLCMYYIKRCPKEKRLLMVGFCCCYLFSALFTGVQGFSFLIFMLCLWIEQRNEWMGKNENTLAL